MGAANPALLRQGAMLRVALGDIQSNHHPLPGGLSSRALSTGISSSFPIISQPIQLKQQKKVTSFLRRAFSRAAREVKHMNDGYEIWVCRQRGSGYRGGAVIL
jgi:hypothetical protein